MVYPKIRRCLTSEAWASCSHTTRDTKRFPTVKPSGHRHYARHKGGDVATQDKSKEAWAGRAERQVCMSLALFQFRGADVEWSTRAPRGHHICMLPNVHLLALRKTRKLRKYMVVMRIDLRLGPMDGNLSNHQNSRAKMRDFSPRAVALSTELHKSVRGHQRTLVNKLPNAWLRARLPILRRGNTSRRQFQRGKSVTSKKRERFGDGKRETDYELLHRNRKYVQLLASDRQWCHCMRRSQ